MTDDSGPTRRQFVRALAVTGGLGLLSGAGTRAYLSDRETYGNNRIEAGQLSMDLLGRAVDSPLEDIDPTRLSGYSDRATRSTATNVAPVSPGQMLSVGPLRPETPQSAVLSLGVDSCTPADLWLRMRLGRPELALASHVQMRVGVAVGDAFDVKYEGVVDELLQTAPPQLNVGALLFRCRRDTGTECLPTFLGLEWTLPSDTAVEQDTTLEFTTDVRAEQCFPGASPTNPWQPMNQ